MASIKKIEAEKIMGVEFSEDPTGGRYENFRLDEFGILEYEYVPGGSYKDDPKEYITFQYDTETGESRHRGICPGNIWTEWE